MREPIVLFVPCYVDALRPAAGIAAVGLLERLGHAVEVMPDVVCCGQPFGNSGQAEEAERLERRWYERMAGSRAVVVLSSSCTVHLRHAPAARRAGGESTSAADTADPAPQVLELCEFLDSRHPERAFGRLERAVVLHSACHGLRDSDADAHARAVLGRIEGLALRRPSRCDECCGFGGTFSVSFPTLSVRMGEDRLSDLLATGAREIVATDLSCLLHLEGIAAARGDSVSFRHVSELLSEALGR